AEIIEKHITIDRTLKGTDQAGSLGKDGVRRMVRDVRLLELGLGKEEIFIEPAVLPVKSKLERSLATKKALKKGDLIRENDLHLLSPGNGLPWNKRGKLIGRRLKMDLGADELIFLNMLD